MRIGLIADIHGNLLALEAVLSALGRDGVDDLICLGDVASLGPQPAEVIARLRALGCPVVMGNTDAWLLSTPATEHPDPDVRAFRRLNAWCAAQLSARELAAVESYPPSIARSLGAAGTLLCFHGSPRSYYDVIEATTSDDALHDMLGDAPATIMAGGHTHVPMLRRYGDARLVNPGSVGLPGTGAATPHNRDPSWAEYAVLSVLDDGVAIAFRRLPLDVDAMIERARACGMPEIAWWVGTWGHLER